MRFLIPEIASSIGFLVTVILFVFFLWILFTTFRIPKKSLEKSSNLPFED